MDGMECFFKDKYELGMYELKNDIVFDKIPKDKYEEYIDFAYERGRKTGEEFVKKLGTNIPSEMAEKLGLLIEEKNMGMRAEEYRVFSEYYSKMNKIFLYKDSIQKEFNKLKEKGLTDLEDYKKIREIFIAHEIYHHLECHEIGLTSREKKVVVFKMGPIKITSGVRSLCEVGAHSFTKYMIKNLFGTC